MPKSRPRHQIPAKHVRRLILASGACPSTGKGREWCELHGLAWSTVHAILKGQQQNVGFLIVDRIVCALDRVDVWYNELSTWYFPPGEPPTPEFKELRSRSLRFR